MRAEKIRDRDPRLGDASRERGHGLGQIGLRGHGGGFDRVGRARHLPGADAAGRAFERMRGGGDDAGLALARIRSISMPA